MVITCMKRLPAMSLASKVKPHHTDQLTTPPSTITRNKVTLPKVIIVAPRAVQGEGMTYLISILYDPTISAVSDEITSHANIRRKNASLSKY